MRTIRTATVMATVLAGTAIALTACTGGGGQASRVAESQEPSGSPSPSAETSRAPAPTDPSPSPSPTASSTGVLPAVSSSQAADLLTDPKDARRAAGRAFELRDTASGTVTYAGSRTVKPSACLNVDSMLDWGAPASPTIGTTTSVSLAKSTRFVYQTITPSDQAQAVVNYMRAQVSGPCDSFSSAVPATLIINNGPSKDIDVTTYGTPRTFDSAGTPVHAYPVTLRFRTSADVSYGRPASKIKAWLLTSAPGNNLVTTLTFGLSGGQVLAIHRGTVERVAAAAAEQATTEGMAEPATFEPADRDSAASAGGATQDDPTWPIDEIAREMRSQWQGSKPSLKQVRTMVLLVCRQMRDIEFTDPNHSATMQNLQGRIVEKWNLDRITGPFNAWNLIGTADARCKGATVITQMN